MKRLLLCRHAKSSWKDGTLQDFDRPLNKRGRANAPEMGRRLAERGEQPDLVLSSPARRALDTATLLAGELGIGRKEILVVADLYDSYPAKLLQVIHDLDNGCDRVLLVGHNPEITILANLLAPLDLENIPTGGIVALDFDVARWDALAEQGGVLAFSDCPREGGGRGQGEPE